MTRPTMGFGMPGTGCWCVVDPLHGSSILPQYFRLALHITLSSTTMRIRHYLALTMIAFSAITVPAQNIRINGFGGYTFQDRFPMGGSYGGYSYNEGRIKDGAHYGGSIEFEVRKNKCIELLYQNQPTEGYIAGSLFEYGPYDITANYIMLGGLGYKPFSPAVSGYGGINIGAAFLTGDANATKFAVGGKLGLMINVSPAVGIKLGAQLLSPVQGVGGGFYFGTGGASAGVSTYSSIYQFGFTGGLCFTLARGSNPAPPRPVSPSGGVPPPPPPSNR